MPIAVRAAGRDHACVCVAVCLYWWVRLANFASFVCMAVVWGGTGMVEGTEVGARSQFVDVYPVWLVWWEFHIVRAPPEEGCRLHGVSILGTWLWW